MSQEQIDYAEALMRVAEELGKDAANPLLYLDVRRLINENRRLREQLGKVVRPAWLLANWNDHNFSRDDQDRWRAETRGACKAVESDLPQ